MITEVDGGFVISSGGMWLPGSYATREAARWAFQFPSGALLRLQEQANERGGDRRITTDDLRSALARGGDA